MVPMNTREDIAVMRILSRAHVTRLYVRVCDLLL